jgi:Fe-S oxidoreductase
MVHAVEFYYELLKSGRIKIARKVEEPITVQDPCNIVRGRGLHEKLRYIMNELCEDFRDVDPRFEHNYCCAAGGGVINCGPPWKLSRMKSIKVKAEQFAATERIDRHPVSQLSQRNRGHHRLLQARYA